MGGEQWKRYTERRSVEVFIYNRRQNELRHFALNGLFDVFRTSKGEKVAFPPPSPPCNVVPLFELPLENKKHPNFEWRGQGRGADSYVSEVTIFEYNVSTILSPIVALHLSLKFGLPKMSRDETPPLLRLQNSEWRRIFRVTGANQNAPKFLFTDLVYPKLLYRG